MTKPVRYIGSLAVCFSTCGAAILLAPSSAALAQSFPSKPVRVVTSAAGGAGDTALRIIGQALNKAWGQPLVVDNRNGTAVVAGEAVARAAPDGYTMLYYGSPFWLSPFLWSDISYDVVKDFAPITLTTATPNVLI